VWRRQCRETAVRRLDESCNDENDHGDKKEKCWNGEEVSRLTNSPEVAGEEHRDDAYPKQHGFWTERRKGRGDRGDTCGHRY
jgi:hypothetical protein